MTSRYRLITIPPSHYCEKARWALELAGLPYNDVLLYGERGTGKSSAVRGLLSRYADEGLRVVEVDRNDLAELPQLLATLRDGTADVPDTYSFLVFCDDLYHPACFICRQVAIVNSLR